MSTSIIVKAVYHVYLASEDRNQHTRSRTSHTQLHLLKLKVI